MKVCMNHIHLIKVSLPTNAKKKKNNNNNEIGSYGHRGGLGKVPGVTQALTSVISTIWITME